MKSRLSLLVGVLISLAAHLTLGWMASVAGPLVAGFLAGKRSAWTGCVTQTVAWAALMTWNVAVAPQESLNMMETLAGLLGGMPAIVTPLLTLLIAALTGLAAGWLGGSFRNKERKN